MLAGLERSRAAAAARFVAHQCGAARVRAIGRAATVAIRFEARGDDYLMQMFVDGNRNGVRSVDIESGVDPPIGQAEALSDRFPGVHVAVAADLELDTEAVRLGPSGLLSFTPLGTATSGSIFIVGKDGTQFAIRVLGVTARTRIERYDRRTSTWVSQW